MSTRKLLVISVISLLLTGVAPSARAGIFTGTCAVNVTFTFGGPIYSATAGILPGDARPSEALSMPYDVEMTGAADLNPLKAGSQACTMDVDPLDPFRDTFASGGGTAVSWTCEEAVGFGSWQQHFEPDPGPVVGSHAIAGPWGNWTMVVNNPGLTFTGTVHLTVAPSDSTTLAQCELGGITRLRMTGVMHLQDPEV
ncbi:MAG TPA: hypothetical protein VIG64_01605 [Actinomycetota bacterium]|jgi:hypothetical protein